MTDLPTVARYTRPDGRVHVAGRWWHRDGCLWLGEIHVTTATHRLRFSSVTPMSTDALAGYATDQYIRQHAARFTVRTDGYR